MKKIKIVSAFLSILMLLSTTFSCNEDMDLLKSDPIQVTPPDTLSSDTTASDSIIHKDSVVVPTPGPVAGVKYVFPNETGFLKTYIQGHPRLILNSNSINDLKEQAKTDPLLSNYVNQVLTKARNKMSTVVYSSKSQVTMYFLDYCWKTLDDVTTLSFAYLWTGDTQYAEKAKKILLSVSTFQDWNPSRYLDVAVMGTAVSLGFDWLYNYLDANSRQVMINGIVKNILTPTKSLIASSSTYWVSIDNNWNLVCNFGAITSSLAVAEWKKDYANYIIPLAVKNLNKPLQKFSPSGSWFEGIMYIKSSLDMLTYGLASMRSSLNNYDFGISSYKGLNAAGDFYVSCYNDNNKPFGFSDIFDNYNRINAANIFYLGSLYNNDDLLNNEKNFIRNRTADVFHVIWYKRTNTSAVVHKNKYFNGDPEIVIFNEKKYGDNSIFMGVKGGKNGASHGHLDLGNFEFEALGVKWAKDLGLDSYTLPNLFDNKVGGKRWDYYRNSSFSHNVPIINNRNQSVTASASFTRNSLFSSDPYCQIDLTNAYPESVSNLKRGIKLIDNNRSIIIQDEFVFKSNLDSYWGMTTAASISLIDGKTALLRLNGKELYAKILSDNAQFSIGSAHQSAPQNPNTGYSRLIAKKTNSSSLNYTLVIQLSPVWNGYRTADTKIVPLNQW